MDIVNMPDKSIMEWYPLHIAVMHDDSQDLVMVKAIMDCNDVNLNAEDFFGDTPYDYAHRHGKYEVLDLFYALALDENVDYTLPVPLQWVEEWHQPLPNAWILHFGNMQLEEALGQHEDNEEEPQDLDVENEAHNSEELDEFDSFMQEFDQEMHAAEDNQAAVESDDEELDQEDIELDALMQMVENNFNKSF